MADPRELQLIISAGKTPRKALRLPQLHFVAVDNWVRVLGKQAFVAWLQLYSWADRLDRQRECDVVPRTLSDLMQKKYLGVSRGTFYNRIIRPLWNYGFIDITESLKSKEASVCNIIVYSFPANDHTRITKELEKLRDYDTEYQSRARSRALNNAGVVSEKLKIFHEKKKFNCLSKKKTGGDCSISFKNRLDFGLKIRQESSLNKRLINYKKSLNISKGNETTTEDYRYSEEVVKEINSVGLANKLNVVVKESKGPVQETTLNESIPIDIVELIKEVEQIIGVSVWPIQKSISSWVNSYGSGYLREKAILIRDNPPREGWTNILGAYTKAVSENWPMPSAARKQNKAIYQNHHQERDERYLAFYDLFPDA